MALKLVLGVHGMDVIAAVIMLQYWMQGCRDQRLVLYVHDLGIFRLYLIEAGRSSNAERVFQQSCG